MYECIFVDISDTIPVLSNVSPHIVQIEESDQKSSDDSVEEAGQTEDGGNISY